MPLLQDDKDLSAQETKEEPYEFEEGQEHVGRLLSLIRNRDNLDMHYEIIMKFKRIFVKGGINRMKYTIPTLIFALFRLSSMLTLRQKEELLPE